MCGIVAFAGAEGNRLVVPYAMAAAIEHWRDRDTVPMIGSGAPVTDARLLCLRNRAQRNYTSTPPFDQVAKTVWQDFRA
jgi:hypothetical protein